MHPHTKKKHLRFAEGTKAHNGRTRGIPKVRRENRASKPDWGPYSGPIRINRARFSNPRAVPYGYNKNTGQNVYLDGTSAHYVDGSPATIHHPSQVWVYAPDPDVIQMDHQCGKDPVRTELLRRIGLCHDRKHQTVRDMFTPVQLYVLEMVMHQTGYMETFFAAVERGDRVAGARMARQLLARANVSLENPQRFWLQKYAKAS